MAKCSELGQIISDMSLNLASRSEIKNIDDIVKNIDVKLTRDQVVEALILASRKPKRKISELSKKLNAIKQEARTDKALKSKIDRLQKTLESGKLSPKVSRFSSRKQSEAIDQLRSIRDDLKKKLRDSDKPRREKTALDKENDRIKNQLEEKVAGLEKNIEEGTLPETRERIIKERTEEIEELRAKRNELKTKISQSEPAIKERLNKQIESLNKRIEEGIKLPVKEPETKLSKELERLQFERDQLQGQIRGKIRDLKPRSVFEKLSDPFNAARSIMTSFDFSAVFRQGGFIVLGNPVRGIRNLPDMFRAFQSPQLSSKINKEILQRSNAPLYARSKLHISPVDDATAALGKREEAYMSRLLDRLASSKIGKVVLFPVKGSERAYVTFLNKLRADSFDTMVAGLAKNGDATQVELEAIANFINVASGRGKLGQAEQAATALNTIFFAPKYVTSRFQLLLGQPFFKGTKRTRKLIAQEYAKFLVGIGTVYSLASMAGFKIEVDPRSSDFGKLRMGDTRIDPLSGLSQVTVLLSRLITGKTKSSISGKISSLRGKDVPFGRDTTFDVMARFLRTKLSPQFGFAVDAVTGENVIGEPVTPGRSVTNLLTPLSIREIGEAIEEQGLPRGTALGLLSIFGMGLATYGPKVDLKALEKKENPTIEEEKQIIKLKKRIEKNRLLLEQQK